MRVAHNKAQIPVGQIFNLLKVLREAKTKNGDTMVICECECGFNIIARLDKVKRGDTKSCGCLTRRSRRNAQS